MARGAKVGYTVNLVEPSIESKGDKTPRILLIDDDPFSYDTVEAQLFQDGYELLFRDNGFDAVRQVSLVAPDVILLDLMMPGINGFEVCQQIKNAPQLEHIPIILFSALDGADNVAAGLAAGADEFLTKPVSRAELRARIRSMLRIKHQYSTLQETLHRRELFSRVLLHDMRNLLSGIVLYTQLLQKRGELSQEQHQYLRLVHEESQRLRVLFDQMQLLGKLQQGQQKIRRQFTDMRLFLREVIPKCAATIDNEAVKLAIVFPQTPILRVSIDHSLLQHMLEVLICHAIRFSPAQTTVKIELAITFATHSQNTLREADNRPVLQIAITDQGPPLPETALDNIYEQVEQWDLATPERPGLGVSLALCKMIAEVHEGQLLIINGATGGVTFVVELPIPESEWGSYANGRLNGIDHR